jgi:D-alanyl-D-alanine carboxypeptidase/D-alanyl-D-alanine-endopeptidase (penicillin-binding protein 4)
LLRALGNGDEKTGIKVIYDILERIGLNIRNIVMVDGSGLSPKNLVSPMNIIKLLEFIKKHHYGNLFYNTLSVAGRDGTISNRMRNTAAENNVHAKTGYLKNVRALSGYVTTRDGEELVFSMICNNFNGPTIMVNNIQDAVCERLANFSRL